MIRLTTNLEIITPCFSGGANPTELAEIRPSAIRGQLRWWFRVLGGFKSSTMGYQEQEIFGGANDNDDSGRASKLIVRVRTRDKTVSSRTGTDDLTNDRFGPVGFLTFPLRPTQGGSDGKRGAIKENTIFSLELIWGGLGSEKHNLQALITVFAHLGSLGFRSRRAMGALAPPSALPMTLEEALACFQSPKNIIIKCLPANSSTNAITQLGIWLKSWRMHGRSRDLRPGNKQLLPPENIGFAYAKNDHDIGYSMRGTQQNPAFRPALGLPIIQRTFNINNWEWNFQNGNATGRFASPIILRPHKDPEGNWRALVIFIDSKKWPAGKKVFLNGHPREVSLDLYNAMKSDSGLRPFPEI